MNDFKAFFDDGQLNLSDETIERLDKFARLLNEWNQIHNLTGAKNIVQIYENIIDSIHPTTFVDEPKSMLDVGTGAGFPGLALGIVWDHSQCVLCEPINKRASFLKYASIELGAKNISIAKMRVEDFTHEPFDLITSRAVTDTSLLLSLTKHLSDNHTSYIFYKGERVFDEIESASHQLKYDIVSRDKRKYLWIKQ